MKHGSKVRTFSTCKLTGTGKINISSTSKIFFRSEYNSLEPPLRLKHFSAPQKVTSYQEELVKWNVNLCLETNSSFVAKK